MRKPRAVLGVLRALKPVDAAGFGCALAYGVLSRSARQSGDPPLILFLAVAVWAALLTFGLYAYHRRNPGVALGPGRLIGWAILFRIFGLLGGPIYEDDFYRYLWDGFRFAGKKLLRRQQLQRARDFVETPGGTVYLSDVQGPEVVSHSSPIVSGHEDRLQGHLA